MRGVFNPSILNHRARNCGAALLLAWMQALVGEMGDITALARTTQKARG